MTLNWIKKKTSDGEKPDSGRPYSFFAILFSVFAALLLWFYVQEAEAPDYKKTFSSVSVEMQSLSSSFSVISEKEITADITLIGKRSDLNKIKASDLEAYVDLSSLNQSGTYHSEINVLVPDGTELLECFPKVATIFVDQTVSVSVPVQVELGSYTVGESIGLDATPGVTQITVKGPKTVLDEIDCAKVRTGDLGEISSSFETNLDYALFNQRGEEIDLSYVSLPTRNVRVRFDVYKMKTVPFTVECKNGWWEKNQMNYSVEPKEVIIKGEPALIDTIESIPAAIIDETTVDATTWTATLTPNQIPLPAGVSLGETLGDIKVRMNLSDNRSRNIRMQFSDPHVAVTAPSGGLTYEFATQALSFKIRGRNAAIQNASANDFYLNIDLSEYTVAGQYEVPIQIVQTSATQGSFYPVKEYSVTVTIR